VIADSSDEAYGVSNDGAKSENAVIAGNWTWSALGVVDRTLLPVSIKQCPLFALVITHHRSVICYGGSESHFHGGILCLHGYVDTPIRRYADTATTFRYRYAAP
jgi:hypothetical protein